MSARKRPYRIFGMGRHGPFSAQTYSYGRGTHPWVVDVCAVSLEQAYLLAARGVWARDAHSAGVRLVRFHDLTERAPYLANPAAQGAA